MAVQEHVGERMGDIYGRGYLRSPTIKLYMTLTAHQF
jgi:hypothetical protein